MARECGASIDGRGLRLEQETVRVGPDDDRKNGFILILAFGGRDSTELTISQVIISLGVGRCYCPNMPFHCQQRILDFIHKKNFTIYKTLNHQYTTQNYLSSIFISIFIIFVTDLNV